MTPTNLKTLFGQGEVSDGDGFKAGDADGCDAEDQLTYPRVVELDDLGGLEAELDTDGGQRGTKVTIFGLKLSSVLPRLWYHR